MEAEHMVTLLIGDTHSPYRSALVKSLDQEDNIQIVGQAGDAPQLQEMAAALRPRVILINSTMLTKLGHDGITQLKQAGGDPVIIVLSMNKGSAVIQQALNAGADAYFPKELTLSDLVKVIRSFVTT
jgi:two-component system invasion response regulator UvrY